LQIGWAYPRVGSRRIAVGISLTISDTGFLAQILGHLSQCRIRIHQLQELLGLGSCEHLTLFAGGSECFAVLGIGFAMHFVPVGLAGLGQQNQRGGIRGLETERQIQQDEGVNIKIRQPCDVNADPDGDDHRLGDEKHRRSEKPGKRLGFESEPIAAENGIKVRVWRVEPEVVRRCLGG